MTLTASDGFDFTMGQWFAELTITAIALAVIVGVSAIAYAVIAVYEWWCDRRLRKGRAS